MLNDEELAALIEVGVESRSIEFKGPGSTSSSEFVAVAARACIALANQRDGGHLVIGVVDKDPGGARGGLDAAQLAEWLDHDTVVSKVNVYADPPLQLQLAQRKLPSGLPVVVIEVAEFAEIPILSAKEFSGKIVRGQLYTRSMAKPESSASNTQNELREVLAVAVEKQLQAFLRTARHAGLAVEAIGQDDVDRFRAERAAFLQEPVASAVAGLPQMSVTIRPEPYRADRLAYDHLPGLVGDNVVRLRGWPFPFVQDPMFGDRWVGEATTGTNAEAWGAYQSGQFIDIRPLPRGFRPDWDGIADAGSEGPYLPVWFPVMFILEAAVFATRLQKSMKEPEPLVVEFSVEGAQGWELVVADPRRSGFHRSYRMSGNRWERQVVLAPDSIDEDINNVAAETSRDLLLRFGWMGVTTELIHSLQDEVLRN